jgi:pilus assembly protein Flp/PilA
MVPFLKGRLREFLRSEDGPTATEYAVMFALILIVCIGSVRLIGTKVNSSFATAATGW